MKFRLILSLLMVTVFVFAACSGDDGAPGATGPAGTDGFPAPMKILFAPADGTGGRDNAVAGLLKSGGLTLGSTITHFSASDSVAPLSVLLQYDAVLIWANSSYTYKDSFGDVLADYVDAGGAVVVTTYANSTSWEIAGRFQTAGYSPWVNGPGSAGANPRTIDFNSLNQPLHKIFNGTDPQNISFWTNSSYSNPGVEASATLIAMDSGGFNAIAINANGRVIGLNWYPPNQYSSGYPDALRVIGNALRCAAGNF